MFRNYVTLSQPTLLDRQSVEGNGTRLGGM